MSTRSTVAELAAPDGLHYEILSQQQLIWRKFKRHRVAYFCMIFLVLFYLLAVFAEFFAPYGPFKRYNGLSIRATHADSLCR